MVTIHMSSGSRPVSLKAATRNSITRRKKSCRKLWTKGPLRTMDKNCPYLWASDAAKFVFH